MGYHANIDSLTEQSLYTSFQAATCFFNSPIGARLGTINSDFGLLRQDSASDKQSFWHKFEDYLVARWVDYARNGDDYDASYTLVLAGEGAPNPDLQRAVGNAIDRLKPGLPGTGPPANFTFLISEEPTFAAARGAAFWRRSMMDRKYCVDYKEPPERDPDDYVDMWYQAWLDKNRRDEL